jgi:hypothetical protein
VRFLSGRAISLTHTFLDDETVLVPSAVAVTVQDASGATVFTGAAVNTAGTWGVSVPVKPLGAYTVTWDGGSTAVDSTAFEVVGSFLFTVPDARGSDMDLADATRFPAGDIRHYREVVEDEFQTITGRSFTRRVRRFEFSGDGSQTVIVPLFDVTAVTAVSDGSNALGVTGWVLSPSGVLQAPYEFTEGVTYTLTLEYGVPFPPDDIKRAGLLRLRSLLTAERSGIPDRATAFVASEGGNFTLAVAGRNGYETGIPDVDAILNRYKYRIVNDVFGVA